MATKEFSIQESAADVLFTQYNEKLKLRENNSFEISEVGLGSIEELCCGLELEMVTLDSIEASILPIEIRMSLKERYLILIQQYVNFAREVRSYIELLNELDKTNFPSYEQDYAKFEKLALELSQEFDKLISYDCICSSLKQRLTLQYDKIIQRITGDLIDNVLPAEIKDYIEHLENTLAAPEIYTLPHLIVLKETAEKKIEIIKSLENSKLPKPIEHAIVKKYESLIMQLKNKILQLRTYPIPEPWCSQCMKEELIDGLEGNFVFSVCPELLEEMKPLKLSERETLPGGIAREEYDTRLDRIDKESTTALEELEARNVSEMEDKIEWFRDRFQEFENDVYFAFSELPLLYRDGRTLEYLVIRNGDDELLKNIYDTFLRSIRHYYFNRINIPSVIIVSRGYQQHIAPPKEERNVPIASGIDRGATEKLQLVTPASLIVDRDTVFVADRYGHSVSWYRANDLAPLGSYHHTGDSPVSLAVFKDSLFVCYNNELVQFSLKWEETINVLKDMHFNTSIIIPQVCCTSSNEVSLFVGTLKPSLILIDTDTLRIDQEFQLNPIRYENRNRYPWLQDMEVISDYFILCLFTGSPHPLQMFSLIGEHMQSILTEDKIVGAYHFADFWNYSLADGTIFISDFWGNVIMEFHYEQFIESFSEKGFGLGQIFHPTGIFVERSGLISICDMKEDNCLQIL